MQNAAKACVLLLALLAFACGAAVEVGPAPADPAATERHAQAFLEAIKPRRAGRPLIAVVALNDGTEMTDFLLTHAALKRSGVADVQAVAPRKGPVALYPADLRVVVDEDLAGFDKAHPSGADYVIVPAMSRDDDPAITGFLKQQVERGARIVGVCAGALVVGRAGLLDGRRFVTHWYFRGDVLERHPTALYVPHLRYVIDRDVATTTGITASVPAMLALVEAIGGRDKAQALADELGVPAWSPAHDSTQFGLNGERRLNYILNAIAFWRREQWMVDVRDGLDDIVLALAADAWTRTGRVTVAASAQRPVKLRSGLVLEAQPADEETPRLPLTAAIAPMRQLDRTLCEIDERFGDAARDRAAQELEYPAAAEACPR